MERREFLKLFGVGAAALGAAAITMSPAQAASTALTPASDGTVDGLLKDLAEANGGEGQFAQFYFVRRRRYYRPRYYFRRRYCRLRWTPWGWRRYCY